jgi:hypothetical protein
VARRPSTCERVDLAFVFVEIPVAAGDTRVRLIGLVVSASGVAIRGVDFSLAVVALTTGSWMQNAPKRDGPLPIYGGPGIDQVAAGVNTMNGTWQSQAITSKPPHTLKPQATSTAVACDFWTAVSERRLPAALRLNLQRWTSGSAKNGSHDLLFRVFCTVLGCF